ncbi:MAG: hypothetical protein FWH14_06150 [Oscillospiraceae bacterium]|nr:hypothetical protein [Oscillospiraceae bacterium]
MRNNRVLKLNIAGLLIAIGIAIPMFLPFPFKIVWEPASYTLASHVPIFIAMFISPAMAAAVASGTTLGFFLGGYPPVIVLRAATHIVFAVMGAIYFKKVLKTKKSDIALRVFSFCIAALHAISEVVVVSIFYWGGKMNEGYYSSGYLRAVILLVGLGTVIHSMVDFELANIVRQALKLDKRLS